MCVCVCVCTEREIFYDELAHMIMEAHMIITRSAVSQLEPGQPVGVEDH